MLEIDLYEAFYSYAFLCL